MVDTAHLYKPTIILSVILFAINYIAIPTFPPALAIMVLYGIVLYNLRDDGRYVKFAIPLLLLDILPMAYMANPVTNRNIFILFIIPIVILIIDMAIMYLAVKRETFYFDRTVVSMNDDDRKKARKALKTKDPDDLADVAAYTDWSYVS